MGIIGIPIGIYGYAFPGNINLMVMELYRSGRYKLLWSVLLLIIVFESLYCSVSLIFISSIKNSSNLYKAIELISLTLVFGMGIWMIFESKKQKESIRRNTIVRGVISIIIHPQQIPFWVIAGVIVSRFIHFDINKWQLIEFVFFNAIGTLMAMGIYMFVGNRILVYLNLNISLINKIMGFAYVFLSVYHFFEIYSAA